MLAEMKKVFVVSFSNDELPELQIAGQAADVLAEALHRAEELDIPVTDRPAVHLEGEYPDFDDFRERYTLVKNPYDTSAALGGCAFGWFGDEWATIQKVVPENLWTLIECEDLWWISPGFHYVNRLGYLVTNERRGEDERSYLYD
jgi:hypothetical protein